MVRIMSMHLSWVLQSMCFPIVEPLYSEQVCLRPAARCSGRRSAHQTRYARVCWQQSRLVRHHGFASAAPRKTWVDIARGRFRRKVKRRRLWKGSAEPGADAMIKGES